MLKPFCSPSVCVINRFNADLCRKKKHVIVNYNTVVPYDHLVIATGLQYQIPAPTGADVNQLMTSSEIEFSPDRRYEGVPPKNVFVINDSYEAAVALYWLENNLLKSDGGFLSVILLVLIIDRSVSNQ